MAMDKNELLKRIEKKEKDIEKINKRIAKWSNGLRPQDIEIVKPFGEAEYVYGTPKYKQQYEIYSQYKNRDDIPKSDDWNKGPNFYELYSAYRDLGDNKATLQKYKISLDKIDNFEKAEKIEVIWQFLTEWENMAYNWYLVNAEKYFELKKNFNQEWLKNKEEYIQRNLQWYGRRDEYRAEKYFEGEYYNSIDNLTMNLTTFQGRYEDGYGSEYIYTSYKVDEVRLAKILKDEKQRKYEDLVNRVTKITGVITDASGLEISAKGNLDGIIIGEKGKAKIQTIGAGGYNIQCFHYRVLVDPIK